MNTRHAALISGPPQPPTTTLTHSARDKAPHPYGLSFSAPPDGFAALRPIGCRPESYVFEREGAPLDDRGILGYIIRPAAEQLGMYFEGFGWHSFRRQNLTVLQEEGATAFEAMAQAGHSRTAMTSEYTIVDLNRREEAVRRLQTRLFGKPETEVA